MANRGQPGPYPWRHRPRGWYRCHPGCRHRPCRRHPALDIVTTGVGGAAVSTPVDAISVVVGPIAVTAEISATTRPTFVPVDIAPTAHGM